jgi:ADP-ribose pyrophosphatase
LNKNEKTLSSELIYAGKNIKVFKEEILTPQGRKSTRDIVRHKGACAVIALYEDKIILINQYRKSLDKVIYEIPAGCIEEGEDIYLCAARELNEETGYEADNLVLLSSVYSTPGFSDEVIHIFYAKNVKKAEIKKDADIDEYIDVTLKDIEEAERLILSGEIADAKTICAFYLYKNME